MRRGAALVIGLLVSGSGAFATAAWATPNPPSASDFAAAPDRAPESGEHFVDTMPGVISQASRLDERHGRFLKTAVVLGTLVFVVGAWAIAWVLRSEPTVALHHLCLRRPASRAPPRSLS